MARIIEDYQDLLDQVRDYINRQDFDDNRLGTFIYLAERKIFRRLRQQMNEKTISFDLRADPDPMEPTQLSLKDRLDMPDDYLETLTIQSNGRPLERISLTEMQGLQWRSQSGNNQGTSPGGASQIRQGEVTKVTRERDQWVLWPFPDGDALIKIIYYCDSSGILDTPTSDNQVLFKAPDLYIYGACLESEPFVKPDDEVGLAMIKVWKQMYDDAFAWLEEQNDREAYSGSTNRVKSAFSGGRSRVNGINTDRTGWS